MHVVKILPRIMCSCAVMLLCCLLTGCFQYFYKTKEPKPPDTDQYIGTPAYQSRYFILRSGANAYHMSNVVLSEDRKMIACQLDTLSLEHTLHLHKGRGGNMRYKARLPEAAVLNEVHLYIPDDTAAKLNSAYAIPVNTIRRVEVAKKNKVQTTASFIIPTLATVAILSLALIVIAFSNLEFE